MTLVVLDIGATLVTGPDRAPWSRLARLLDLSDAQRLALRDLLLTTAFQEPGEVAARVRALGVPGDVDGAVRAVWTAQEHEAQPLDGALGALEALAAAGSRLALISNIWRPYLRSVWDAFGPLFDAAIPPHLRLFSFREGLAKPAPELFRRVLERAGVAPADAVMVGDSYAEDIEPALACGMRAVWLLRRPQREAADLLRVLNGDAPRPARTLAGIAHVTPALLHELTVKGGCP